MKLPSKITPFKKSTLAAFTPILEMLVISDMTPDVLYEKTRRRIGEISIFIEALDCLFALNKIELLPEGVLHYVE